VVFQTDANAPFAPRGMVLGARQAEKRAISRSNANSVGRMIEYWPIRDRLVDAGRLALGKGKGGGVRLIAAAATEPAAPGPIAEAGQGDQVPPAPPIPEAPVAPPSSAPQSRRFV